MAYKRPSDGPNGERKRKKMFSANECTAGIIQKVTLKNFMCHENFSHSFGSRVNILYGRNGSGKSAILTAIVIGLGGKSSFTGKGSLKSFIKNGKQSAKISITLSNAGQDAYKPEKYGDEIIIERHIQVDRSSFKIKEREGTFSAIKKDDLKLIVSHFNIQIDNPVSILTQECSRNFLSSKNPKDKYAFFCKATQLEQLELDYSEARKNIKTTQGVLHRKEQILPILEKTVSEWEEKLNFHKSLSKQKERKKRLENEFAWALVIREEKEASEHFQLVQTKQNEILKVKNRIEQMERKLLEFKEEKKIHEENLKIINQKLEDIQKSRTELFKKHMELKKIQRKNVCDIQRINNDSVSLTGEEQNLLRKIIELTNSASDCDNRKEAEKTLSLLNQEMNVCQTKLNEINNNDRNLKSDLNSHIDLLNTEKRQQNHLFQKKDFLNKSLVNLRATRTNQILRFGRYVPELIQKIDSAFNLGKFSQKPKGPIGSLIKLKDPKWSLAVESCLKRTLLCAFCCDNHRDASILQTLINSVTSDHKPSVIVSKFLSQIYDTSPYEVRLWGFVNVLQIIECNDPVVINFLIDQRNIESVLLVEQNNDARRIMINNPPANCRECFTLRGDRVFPSPNFRYYSCSKKNEEFLQMDVQNAIKEKQEQHNKVINEIHVVEENVMKHCHSLEEIKKNIKQLEKDRNEINLRINNVSNGIFEAKVALEQTPTDVNALEEDLRNIQQQKIHLQNEEQKLLQLKTTNEEEISKGETDLGNLDHRINNLLHAAEEIKDPLRQKEAAIEGASVTKKHHESQLRDQNRILVNLEEKAEAVKNAVEKNIAKASCICPRIYTSKAVETLENEIKKISSFLEMREETYGTYEEVVQKYSETSQVLSAIKNNIENMKGIVQQLDEASECRLLFFKSIRNQVTIRVKHFFLSALSIHHFSGKMDINHKDGTLEVIVQPKTNLEKINKDMKSLSGGERSFTTISLILAFWDTIETPFRILDEFDVFMDMVFRKLSTDMLLETALHKKSNQFIIFTPLDHSSIRISPEIQIHVLEPPERGPIDEDRNQT